MKYLYPTFLFLNFLISFTFSQTKPDTNFKSIHQIEYELHQKDTTKVDTTLKIKSEKINTLPEVNRQVGTIINFSLLILIIIILIVIVAVFLIARRIFKTKSKGR